MAQTRKADVHGRILDAALQVFADNGYEGSSMAAIASSAGTATANVYRYFADKSALFAAAVPDDLVRRHDALLDARIDRLAGSISTGPIGAAADPADELLGFWVEHRLAVAILLDRAVGTPHAGYPAAFAARLVGHVERRMPAPPSFVERQVLEIVFDNTRRAIAAILRSSDRPDDIRTLINGFWSYQIPGLAGLLGWVTRAS